jgi:hypothetical protein
MLPATLEYFNKQKTGKYGLHGWCRACFKEYNAGRQQRHNASRNAQRHAFQKRFGINYEKLHVFIRMHKHRTNICVRCHAVGNTQFANISGEYKKDINDYEELCIACHHREDKRRPYSFKPE